MLENLAQVNELISLFLKVSGVVGFGVLIIMGLVHRFGNTTWLEREQKRRRIQGLPNPTLISQNPGAEFPWKDPSLIQGGLRALSQVVILMGYVLTMMIVIIPDMEEPTADHLYTAVGVLMAYPIIMIAVLILLYIWNQRSKDTLRSLWWLIVVSISGSIASFYLISNIANPLLFLAIQVGLLVALSLGLSYIFGMLEGIRQADVETRFPIVEVITRDGSRLQQLRLYETTDTDYRLISESGIEHIIPGSNIREVRHYSMGPQDHEDSNEKGDA